MKKFKAVVFVLVFIVNMPVFAVPQCTNEQVCFSEDIMKEVVKETMNVVGKHLLEKYFNENKQQNVIQNQLPQNNTSAENVETTTSSSNTSPEEEDEEIIIIE